MIAKKNGSFIKLDRQLINSPSWLKMSINCKRLLDFLMEDHLRHGGKHNGRLKATYDQLVAAGIPRRLISRTISEAEYLELIRVERGGRRGCVNDMSTFMVTFLPLFENDRWCNPSGSWKNVTEEQIRSYQRNHKIKSKFKVTI